MKKLHEAIKSLPPSAQNQTVNAERAREKLDEAENLLAHEPSGPAPGMGMNMQMAQMMQSMQRRPNRGGMTGGGMMGGGMAGAPPGGRRGVDLRAPAGRPAQQVQQAAVWLRKRQPPVNPPRWATMLAAE